ncbi:hypothetical protein KUH03_14530 [Sphingobacterium sp. E70]|uniref:hypothetical protein n=1 Tax=Sphingobacterium sp. E70 TaxID=2853439 RepID=UPI002795A89C|nr:hypothetical protein [Sphingobacterium sp. E70]ULT27763.1 hypothetical protein KUH03_14530 [Sphingobacterium sp. E70]
MDVFHEDLKDVVWINTKDSVSNGKDADGNGYINDKYGWNFIGNADGKDVQFDNLELTRQLRILDKKFAHVTPTTELNEADRKAFWCIKKWWQNTRISSKKPKWANFPMMPLNATWTPSFVK